MPESNQVITFFLPLYVLQKGRVLFAKHTTVFSLSFDRNPFFFRLSSVKSVVVIVIVLHFISIWLVHRFFFIFEYIVKFNDKDECVIHIINCNNVCPMIWESVRRKVVISELSALVRSFFNSSPNYKKK